MLKVEFCKTKSSSGLTLLFKIMGVSDMLEGKDYQFEIIVVLYVPVLFSSFYKPAWDAP